MGPIVAAGYGQTAEPESVARVRQFAAAVRRGLAGETPAPGVDPLIGSTELRNRQAGLAAAPLLGSMMPPGREQGPAAGRPGPGAPRPGGWRAGVEGVRRARRAGAEPKMPGGPRRLQAQGEY